jgi:hypothetical protein
MVKPSAEHVIFQLSPFFAGKASRSPNAIIYCSCRDISVAEVALAEQLPLEPFNLPVAGISASFASADTGDVATANIAASSTRLRKVDFGRTMGISFSEFSADNRILLSPS